MTAAHFLDAKQLLTGGPRRFNLAVERLLLHLGFDDIRVIDGAGDGGGDILAVKGSELFVFQNKWTTAQIIGRDGVDEVECAKTLYNADRAVVVTNALPDGAALKRVKALVTVGIKIDIWTRQHLPRLYEAIPLFPPSRFKLREYQQAAVAAIERDLAARRRALIILATGLGKSVVAGDIVCRWLDAHPTDPILVVATMKDLVQQLERAFWRHLPKDVPTQMLTGDTRPTSLEGVTFATMQSTPGLVYDGYRPALLLVDESHHVSEEGQLQDLLHVFGDAAHLGMTATPWRGDRYDISHHFGAPSFKLGIAEGMARGYLAQVDYRMFVDNIDWDMIRTASREGYTIRELNSKLFLPQRDERIAELLWETWTATPNPRAILFCRTIEHAERMADFLSRYTAAWGNATCLHSAISKRDREVLLGRFRLGTVPLLIAVDILNEGVDVPDVNIIGFLRVTHSRRIFVQQLGRGLRLRAGKDRVTVLDFVTDVRRVAAVLTLRRDLDAARGPTETLLLKSGAAVTFSNSEVDHFMDAWLRDAADVETATDEARLNFPDFISPYRGP